jgi:class 3 adenylate cyclase
MPRVVIPLIVVAFVGATAAVAYRYLWDDPSEANVANYLRSGAHGMVVALAGWGCHLYFSSRASGWPRRWPLLAEVGVRAVAMALTIAAVIAGLQMVLYGQALEATWLLANFPGIFVLAFVLSVAFSAVFELTRLIGGHVLLNVILGRYRHPIREERVLLFLDLAGSTAMAEILGEVRIQELLTRFFFDIDEPIVAHGGEVHAYVGDAVIVTWPLTRGGYGSQSSGGHSSEGGCLDCFFAVEDRIEQSAESYRREFGWVPRFRAALHAGPVVISECGDSRRQIAYFGDTVNVTARLQEHAKEAGRSLIVSADLLKHVQPSRDIRVVPLGHAALRGRAAAVEVFAVERGQGSANKIQIDGQRARE